MRAPKPFFQLIYAGKNITEDIARFVISFKYTDNVAGKADELSITLEDSESLWRGDWYPQKGDKIEAKVGTVDNYLNCGTFFVDELELTGPPDVVVIKAISHDVKGKLRTRKSAAHENKTLKQIAQTVADAHGLTLQGTVPNISILRVTQNEETDLGFLNRISEDYGIAFAVKGTLLVFTDIYELEAAESVVEIDRSELTEYSLKDKSFKTFKDAQVTYHNPQNKKLVNKNFNFKTVTNADNISFTEISTGDTLNIKKKAENPQQAEAMAKAHLHRANSKQQEGSFSMPGNPKLVSGNNFELTGIGTITGKYHIMKAEHEVNRGGYTVEAEVKRVGFLIKVKSKPKHPRKKKPVKYTRIQ